MGSTKTARGFSRTGMLRRLQRPRNEEEPLLIPLSGIGEADAKEHILKLVPGTGLRLEVHGQTVTVHDMGKRLGLLEGSQCERITRALQSRRAVRCELWAVGGTEDDPSAIVAVWI